MRVPRGIFPSAGWSGPRGSSTAPDRAKGRGHPERRSGACPAHELKGLL